MSKKSMKSKTRQNGRSGQAEPATGTIAMRGIPIVRAPLPTNGASTAGAGTRSSDSSRPQGARKLPRVGKARAIAQPKESRADDPNGGKGDSAEPKGIYYRFLKSYQGRLGRALLLAWFMAAFGYLLCVGLGGAATVVLYQQALTVADEPMGTATYLTLAGYALALLLVMSVPVYFIAWIRHQYDAFFTDYVAAQEWTSNLKYIRQEQRSVLKEIAAEGDHLRPLVNLVCHSRLEMQAYYEMGLQQAERSYRSAKAAMWVGFAAILIGVVLPFVPLESFEITRPTGLQEYLPIAAGLVIEMISVLFFWMYRSSMTHLTDQYNRQMGAHDLLMGVHIAGTLGDEQRESLTADLVQSFVTREWTREQPELPTGIRQHRGADPARDGEEDAAGGGAGQAEGE